MSKLFKSILNERLTAYCDQNKIISENQTGFRIGYSTVDHIFVLKCIIDLLSWEKKKLYCLFVDYKKAFDVVWREGLWYKHVKSGINGKVYNLIKNMYFNIVLCLTPTFLLVIKE